MQDDAARASALLQAGAFAEALALFKKLLSQSPKNPQILNLMAMCEASLGRPDNAMRFAARALRIDPANPAAHNILGTLLTQGKQYGKALPHLEEAARLAPRDTGIRLNLTLALNAVFRSDDALPHALEAVALDGNNAEAALQAGRTLKALGRTEEAEGMYRRVVSLSPLHVDAWAELARTFRLGRNGDVEAFQRALDNAATVVQRARLHFAAAGYHEKRGDFDRAIDHLETGNALYRGTLDYDVSRDEERFEAIARVFDRETVRALADKARSTAAPIFLVGMPRSGSTLIEQVLSGHSKVVAGGELPALATVIAEATASRPFPEAAARWRAKDLERMGKRYLEEAAVYTREAPLFTDKYLPNFLHVGLIAAMFPRARILDCRRDPVENCLSIYRLDFAGRFDFAYDQAEIVRYYKAHRRLMAHWHDVVPDNLLDVRLEDMIADPEAKAREILAFCGLDWEPGCLDIASNKRPVHTVSATQVTGGIATETTRRHESYAPHIRTILDGFRD